jgi:cation:H+ antiporter
MPDNARVTVPISVVLLVAGAALLTAGAEAFAEHVEPAASRLGVSVLALGVLLAGAEPEEAVTAMVASGQGHPALAAGDAVGANLVIGTLTLGLAAVLTGLPVGRRVVEYAVAAAVAGALLVLFAWNGVLGRTEGAVLVACYVLGVVWVWRREQAPPLVGELAEREGTDREVAETRPAVGEGRGQPGSTVRAAAGPRALLLVLLGVLGMVVGGYLAVRGADGLVGVLGIGESAIGLTVLALATSAEMLALVWAAHRRGVSEVVVAGLVGAMAYNATVSVGLGALVRPLGLGRGSPVLSVGLLTAALPLVLLAGWQRGRFPRPLGVVLVLAYLVAVGALVAGG